MQDYGKGSVVQHHADAAHMTVVLLLPSFMKQAGEGADYLEGCEGARSQRCFKCGAVGHRAAECRGLEVWTMFECRCWSSPYLATQVFFRRGADWRAKAMTVTSIALSGAQADGEEGPDLPAKATARAAAAAAARPSSVRPAGDMWAPAGGYQVGLSWQGGLLC